MKLVIIPLVALVAGCATSHKERDALLAAPINCEVAEADIAALEAAKPSRRERARSAMQSVTPVGAVRNAAKGTYDDNLEVLTGATEEELTARIDEIQAECGLPTTADPAAE